MNTTNETRRDVMATAWGMFRADPARGFAVALAGAWRWIKGRAARIAANAAWLARVGGRTVVYASPVQSPIRRSLSGPYAATRARTAGYTTSMMGR